MADVVGYVTTTSMLCTRCAHVTFPMLEVTHSVRDEKGNRLMPLLPDDCAQGDSCAACGDMIG